MPERSEGGEGALGPPARPGPRKEPNQPTVQNEPKRADRAKRTARRRPQPFSPGGEDVPSEVEGQMRGPLPCENGSTLAVRNQPIRPLLAPQAVLTVPAPPHPPRCARGPLPEGRGVSAPRPIERNKPIRSNPRKQTHTPRIPTSGLPMGFVLPAFPFSSHPCSSAFIPAPPGGLQLRVPPMAEAGRPARRPGPLRTYHRFAGLQGNPGGVLPSDVAAAPYVPQFAAAEAPGSRPL